MTAQTLGQERPNPLQAYWRAMVDAKRAEGQARRALLEYRQECYRTPLAQLVPETHGGRFDQLNTAIRENGKPVGWEFAPEAWDDLVRELRHDDLQMAVTLGDWTRGTEPTLFGLPVALDPTRPAGWVLVKAPR